MYLGLVAVLINIIVGVVVSLITGNICFALYIAVPVQSAFFVKFLGFNRANFLIGIANRQVNTNPQLGYLWWYKAAENPTLPSPVLEEKQDDIQASLQQEATVLVQSLSNQNLQSEDRKQKFKLKRKNTSSSSLAKSRDNPLSSITEDSEATREPGGERCANGVVIWTMGDGDVFSADVGATCQTADDYDVSGFVVAEGVWCKLWFLWFTAKTQKSHTYICIHVNVT